MNDWGEDNAFEENLYPNPEPVLVVDPRVDIDQLRVQLDTLRIQLR